MSLPLVLFDEEMAAAGGGNRSQQIRQAAQTVKVLYDEVGKPLAKYFVGKSRRRRRKRKRKRVARRARRSARQVQPKHVYANVSSNSGFPVTSLATAQPLRAPVAMQTALRQSYAGLKSYRVTHTEYVDDVISSMAFDVRSLRVNPAEACTFPWLTRIARNYEKYKFRSLRFFLKTTAPTSVGGSIILAYDYDPTDSPPANKQQILQYSGATRGAPWMNLEVELKRNEVQGNKFMIAGLAASDDALRRQQDPCLLLVATSGMPDSGTTIAELWVQYDVDLFTPQHNDYCPACVLQKISPFTGAKLVLFENFDANLCTYIDSATVMALEFNLTGRFLGQFSFNYDGGANGHEEIYLDNVLVQPIFIWLDRIVENRYGTVFSVDVLPGQVLEVRLGATLTAVKVEDAQLSLVAASTGDIAPVVVPFGPGQPDFLRHHRSLKHERMDVDFPRSVSTEPVMIRPSLDRIMSTRKG